MNPLLKYTLALGKIGCIGFGGGSALIPVIEDVVIQEQKIDTKENFDKDVVVASITPGALPVEIASSLGRRNFGLRGMVLGATAMAAPGAFFTVVLLSVLAVAMDQVLTAIEVVSLAASAFIILLLTQYIIGVFTNCKKESPARFKKAWIVTAGVFVLASGRNMARLFGLDITPIFSVSTFHILLTAFFCFFYLRGKYTIGRIAMAIGISTVYLLGYGRAQVISNSYIIHAVELVMLVLSIHGLVMDIRKENWNFQSDGKSIRRDVVFWIGLVLLFVVPVAFFYPGVVRFALDGILSALMSFGGGDAYLTIADGLFVEGGLVTESQFYGQIVSVVNVLPGSILCKTLAGIGYYAGMNQGGTAYAGVLFALVGFVCSVSASCCFSIVVYHLYDSLISLHVFKMISRWIRPIIAGLLGNIMLSLVNQSAGVAGSMDLSKGVVLLILAALVVLDVLLVQKWKRKPLMALGVNLILVFVIYFI